MSVSVQYPAGIDFQYVGTVTFSGPTNYKAGSILDAAINAAAAIQATKLQGEYNHNYSQTGTVAAATLYFGAIRGLTATLVSLQGCITETIATGADRTVTVDLLKSTGAGAFASVLTTPLVFNNASVLRTITAALITTAGAVVGDHYKLTVAVAGAAGNQALGLSLRAIWREDAA